MGAKAVMMLHNVYTKYLRSDMQRAIAVVSGIAFCLLGNGV